MNNNDTIAYYNQNAAKFCQRTLAFDMSYCQNKQPVECCRFEDMEWEKEFDGVWASASLLHVRKADLSGVLGKLHRALKSEGILYVSVKYGADEEERLGRFFSDYSMGKLKEMLEKEGLFDVLECFETADARAGYEDKPWVNAIAKKKHS